MAYSPPLLLLTTGLLAALCASFGQTQGATTPDAHWRFVLESPGGELPFGVTLRTVRVQNIEHLEAFIHNGEERIELGPAECKGNAIRLRLAPYDSTLVATIAEDGKTLEGTWSKSLGGERVAQLPLRGTLGASPRFALKPTNDAQRARLDGTWSVKFASDEDLALGHFTSFADGRAVGTFETTLGDYRFLAGTFDGQQLKLSCFDGGHAFLFHATLDEEGTLNGDFWSRDSWHDTWTAQLDPDAKLSDAFGITTWREDASLRELVFPDVNGTPHSLGDSSFDGRARIISLFGTWCPNCNDEAKFLGELAERYGPRGLSIVGLAFELDNDFERSCQQVERFRERHGVHYPILIAGEADKQVASTKFPALDRVRAYPTAIFLDANNKVRAVHTGFSGPATGAAHDRMRERYETLLETILAETKE